MKLLKCPINGTRPASEFVYHGAYREMPDPKTASDLQWATYVHHRNNAPEIKKEWWYHTPSGTWFIAVRNTLTDEVEDTYLYSKLVELESTK